MARCNDPEYIRRQNYKIFDTLNHWMLRVIKGARVDDAGGASQGPLINR